MTVAVVAPAVLLTPGHSAAAGADDRPARFTITPAPARRRIDDPAPADVRRLRVAAGGAVALGVRPRVGRVERSRVSHIREAGATTPGVGRGGSMVAGRTGVPNTSRGRPPGVVRSSPGPAGLGTGPAGSVPAPSPARPPSFPCDSAAGSR